MPYSDPKKHRDYYRDYMRRRRAGQAKAKPKPADSEAIAKLEARIRELEAERDALKKELADSVGERFAPRQRATPKAAKPPLPPDEQRERTIKGLRTRVRNLEAELSHERTMHQLGVMSFKTMSLIAKCLHPETRKHVRDTELDDAMKAFTVWKSDRDKARRSR